MISFRFLEALSWISCRLPSLTHFVHLLRADVSFPTKNKVTVEEKKLLTIIFSTKFVQLDPQLIV